MKTIYALILIVILTACLTSQNAPEPTVISPPFKGIDIAYTSHTINPNKDTVITTNRGSIIQIPAHAFTNQDGHIIHEPVQFKYRAFHSNAEIIVSGIPLTYDTAGQAMDFISAGMFEIDASLNDQALKINPNSKIEVAFASYKNGSDFNFYRLNETTGNWEYKGKTTPEKNTAKAKKTQRFLDQFIIKLDLDYSVHKELKAFDQLSWIYVGKDPKIDPQLNPWIFKEKWRQIELSAIDRANGHYNMYLKSKNKTLNLPVSPYVEGNDTAFLKAIDDGILKYNEIVKQRKKEEHKIQLEADIIRRFEISSFGYYNWDKINQLMANDTFWRTDANISINQTPKTKESKVYLFTGNDKTMTIRQTINWQGLIYPKHEKNTLLIILDNNDVAISNPDAFHQAINQTSHHFNLQQTNTRINSIEDLEALLAKI